VATSQLVSVDKGAISTSIVKRGTKYCLYWLFDRMKTESADEKDRNSEELNRFCGQMSERAKQPAQTFTSDVSQDDDMTTTTSSIPAKQISIIKHKHLKSQEDTLPHIDFNFNNLPYRSELIQNNRSGSVLSGCRKENEEGEPYPQCFV
jgi:hypothetical protein